MKMRAVTYSECQTIFLTPFEKQLGIKTSSKYLNPAEVVKVERNAHVIPQGIDCDIHAKIIEGEKKYDRFTLYWGGRFIANKRWEDILPMYRQLKIASGGEIDIEVTTAAVSLGRDTSAYGDIKIHLGPTHEELFKVQARCHAGMVYSHFEALPIGFLEQILSGVVLVWWDRPWSRAVLGNSYPFYFTSELEARAMLKWIRDNYAEATEKMAPVKKMIWEKYDIKSSVTALDNLMQTSALGTWTVIKSEDKLFEVLKEMPDEFTFSNFVTTLIKKYPGYGMGLTDIFVSVDRGAELGKRDLYMWCRKQCDDTFATADPTFKKRK